MPISEQHPVVVNLRSLGYELEECFEAAELHPEDAVAATNYLTSRGRKGELFMLSAVESVKHIAVPVLVEGSASTQEKSYKMEQCEEKYVKDSSASFGKYG